MRRGYWRRRKYFLGRTGAISLAVLVVVVVAALVVDSRTSVAGVDDLTGYIESRRSDPVELLAAAGRADRMVFLSDIHPLATPKRIAAGAIEALAEGPGLDAVVLEVPSDEQPYIERYLHGADEDAAMLLARSRLVHEDWGVPRAYLEIFRTVWRLNQEMDPARQIRIVAADLPEWPPSTAGSPEEIATLYARRPAHMEARIREEVLTQSPQARLFLFMDGYLGLAAGHGEGRFAGGQPVSVEWLRSRLAAGAGREGRTILVDAASNPSASRRIPAYHGTEIYPALRRALDDASTFGVPMGRPFDFMAGPVRPTNSPGFRFFVAPDSIRLTALAEGYIFLGPDAR